MKVGWLATLVAATGLAWIGAEALGLLPSSAGPQPQAVVRVASWDELVPKDWDPLKRYRALDLAALRDDQPESARLLREMRESWDNAPTNARLNGSRLKLPGYVVPLEAVNGALSEFLLVPYFGACIHTPPPPANQIVHVMTAAPVAGLQTMDTVWVSGTLRTTRKESELGTSGYRIEAAVVEHYRPVPTRPASR